MVDVVIFLQKSCDLARIKGFLAVRASKKLKNNKSVQAASTVRLDFEG
jgi:hypothetical protein